MLINENWFKIFFPGSPANPPTTAKALANKDKANQRERNRVKNLNGGFKNLRASLPSAEKQKKLSKFDTLKHAANYVQFLKSQFNESELKEIESELNEIAKKNSTTSNPDLILQQPPHTGKLKFLLLWWFITLSKRQLISKCPFGAFKSPKKPTNFL